MPNNYILLERIELNASAATVTFANIPQTGYTDLKLVISARDTFAVSAVDTRVRFNSDSGTNYTHRQLLGNGASASSNTNTVTSLYTAIIPAATSTASTFGNYELYIPNYTASTQKSVSSDNVSENNGTTAYTKLVAGLWTGTAAINSITFLTDGTAFDTNSTFSLYGLAALGTTPARAPKASGGNIIDFDGTYWIHTFLSSGTFTPQTGLTCDYLVVAGGGGGSYGGGGAGGFRTGSSFSVSSPSTVTIGAGGTGRGDGGLNPGTSGSDSIFSTITSTGGGGGGGANGSPNQDGKNGGSGGGAGYTSIGGSPTFGTGNTPSTSPSQGNNGGTSRSSGDGNGGGGGAGSAGGNATANASGNGGAGSSSSISGTSVTYAGGGGGAGGTTPTTSAGSGGSGGGGAGSTSGVATNGTANRGGGGGAGNFSALPNSAGAGGSGIVIIRYLAV